MKNPCDLCIVRVNCTQVCWQKENNMALLKTAVAQCMRRGQVHPYHIKDWSKYHGLYNQCLTDLANIQMRAREAKEGMRQSSF
jgi:hypothetical protein